MKGGAIHKSILHAMAQSAYSGKTRLKISSFDLIFSTPTLKFYKDRNTKLIVVAIRGTQPADKVDLAADALSVIGQLRRSERYRKDKETMQYIQSIFPPTEYRYIAVGHSLGGAILDLMLRDGLVRNGLSYNAMVEPHELGGNPLHQRIYHKDDPLYKLFGRFVPNVEVRTTAEPIWKYYLKYALGEPIGDLFQYYDRHSLDIFRGGKVASAFGKQLEELGISPSHYLEMARKNAKANGYDPKSVSFSDDKTHKLQVETPEGKVVRFGRVGYNDFLIWSHLEANKKVKSGTAKAKQSRFQKSHSKIKGDWKDNPYSPNNLALSILW